MGWIIPDPVRDSTNTLRHTQQTSLKQCFVSIEVCLSRSCSVSIHHRQRDFILNWPLYLTSSHRAWLAPPVRQNLGSSRFSLAWLLTFKEEGDVSDSGAKQRTIDHDLWPSQSSAMQGYLWLLTPPPPPVFHQAVRRREACLCVCVRPSMHVCVHVCFSLCWKLTLIQSYYIDSHQACRVSNIPLKQGKCLDRRTLFQSTTLSPTPVERSSSLSHVTQHPLV